MANESVVITRMSGGIPAARVAIVHMQGASAGTGQVVITHMQGASPGLFEINPGGPQTLDPFQTVQLNATVATLGVTADSWQWAQISGTPVLLVGIGPSVQYRAPATLFGDTLVFEATGTLGTTTVAARVAHVIRSHTGYWRVSPASPGPQVLYGVEYRRTPRIPLVAVQPPGQPVPTAVALPTSAVLMTQG